MKTAILFLTIFIATKLSAQPFGKAADGFRVISQNYENKSGEKGLSIYKYDNNGYMSKGYWALLNGSRHSINYYSNNEKGNLVSAFRELTGGITSCEIFIYDSSGRKISEQFYRSDGVKGSASYKYENGNLKRAELNNHKGWLSGVVIYEYDKNNKMTGGKLFKNDTLISNINYEYDSDNNLIKEEWDFLGQWGQTAIYKYEKINPARLIYYSSPFIRKSEDYRIIREYYTYNNQKGGPSIYIYNKDGLLQTKKFVRSDSLTTLTNYEYDIERKLVKSFREFNDGSSMNFYYNYDVRGNLIQRIFYKEKSQSGFEDYIYNNHGELTNAYYKNVDGWLNGTITFEYDIFGKLGKGLFKGADGYDAEIIFSYNDEGLLTEILWKFSTGDFQKYNFEYDSVENSAWLK